MVRCRSCFNEYDEEFCAGVCPNCGYYEGKDSDDPRALPIGTVIQQRYVVGGVLGVGGFGITYKVWDTKLVVCRALKEYFQQGVVNRIPGTQAVFITAPKRREEFEYGKSRLLEEAQKVAKFSSESIVRVHDFFEENNTAYMVMEYLNWQTLENYIIERNRFLSPEEAIKFALYMCEALEEIHKAGMVHRDISPDNIFIHEDGRIKIIDFGSARLSEDDTEDRMIMIKPGFAPPEQYEKIDPKNDQQKGWTDVYALGATLYLVLTGVMPAESSDRKADFHNGTDRVCYPHEINKSIPEFLSNAIMTAMAINIHERFQTAGEFAEALRQERKVLPIEVVRKKKRFRRKAGITGGLLVSAAILASAFMYNDSVRLEPADITLWYCVDEENEQQKAAKDGAMQTIVKEAMDSNIFQKVTITAQSFSEEEYDQALQEAFESNNMPTLFECINADAEYMNETLDLTDVAKTANTRDETKCYFINNYRKYFSNPDRLPVGFDIPVVYINTTSLAEDEKENISSMKITSMEDLMALDSGEMKYNPMALNEEIKNAYQEMLDDFSSYEHLFTEENAKNMFLEGDAAMFLSDTSDYLDVHSSLAGKYVMLPMDTDEVICNFSNYYSISNCEEAEKAAAEELLIFMLGEDIQDKYYLQNSANTSLPLNKTAVHNYADVRRKFDVLLGDLSNYTFEKE